MSERTYQTRDDTADGWGDAEEMRDGARVEQLVLQVGQSHISRFSGPVTPTGVSIARQQSAARSSLLTGTFLWVMSTAVSSPRIAIAVCPEPEMALKAYS